MKKLLGLILFFILTVNSVKSTHVVSADLTYECLGGLNYKITLKIYRDCSGQALGFHQNISYNSASLSSSGLLLLFYDTSYEISQVCDSLISQSTCNGGSFSGTEIHTYSRNITLSGYAADWEFISSLQFRSSAITNLLSGFNLFTKTTLNNLPTRCNNSPVFIVPPILYVCAGEQVNFNNIARDPDGDSLSFKLVRTLGASNINIPYTNPSYTALNPFSSTSGIVFNSITGQLSFTSSTLQQAIITVLITQYDANGNVIGTQIRDIQFIIIVCTPPSFTPYITGVNYDSIDYVFEACYNNSFCFNIYSITFDTTKPIIFKYYGNLPGVTFTSYRNIDTTFGTFCWNPGTRIGKYFFNIEATVDFCPLKRQSVFNYTIDVDTTFNTCIDTTLYLHTTGNITIDSTFVTSTVGNMGCPAQSVLLSKNIFDCDDIGLNIINVTTTYQNGLTRTCQANVTIIDTISPIVACLDTTIYLNSSGNALIDTSFIHDLNVISCGTSNLQINKTSFNCNDIGQNIVKLTITETGGLQDSCFGIVTVLDTFSPTARTNDTSVYLNPSGQVIIDSSFVENGSTDNCSVVRVGISKNNFNCSDVGINPVTVTVEDSSGNISISHVNVTVIDTNKIIARCKDTIVYLQRGGFTLTFSHVDNGSRSVCKTIIDSLSKYDFTCMDTGQNSVSVYVKDSSGAVDSCTSIVTILDTSSINFTCKDTIIYLNDSGYVVLDSSYILGDTLSTSCNIDRFSLSADTFYCSEIGVNSVKLFLNYLIGPKDSCSAGVTVLDTIAPTAICNNITVSVGSSGNIMIDSSYLDNGSYDNCDIASITLSKTNFECTSLGINNVVVTVTDGSGNSSTCTATVTVLDSISPVVQCVDTTIYITTLGTFTITTNYVDNGTFDNCKLDSLWLSKYVFDCTDVGQDTIQLFAKDSSGNIDSCSAIITVNDTSNPAASCADTTIYLDSFGMAVIDSSFINNSTGYGCDISNIVLSSYSFNCFHIGTNRVMMYVTDVNGNMDSCYANVTVLDTIAPTAICNNITVSVGSSGNIMIDSSYLDNGSYDNCDIASITLSKTNFDCTSLGINNVVVTVTDGSGNSSTCTATVTVFDSISPVVQCIDTTIYITTLGTFTITTNYVNNGTFDNCKLDSLWLSKYVFDCTDVGQDTIQLFAKDSSGNIDSCSAIITVNDTSNPAASCADTTIYLDSFGMAVIDSSFINNSTGYGCDISNIVLSSYSFNCFHIGTNRVMMYVTDVNGNMDSCYANVTVLDTISPTAICQDTVVYIDTTGTFTINSSYVDAGSYDNCTIDTIILSKYTFTCADVGINTILIYVYDSLGLVDSCQSIVTVNDTTNPDASCADTTIYLNQFGVATIDSSFVNGLLQYGCDISSITLSQYAFDCTEEGVNSVVMIVQDVNGNSDSCFSNVTVVDTLNPLPGCKNARVYLNGFGIATIDSSFIDSLSSDNCAVSTIKLSQYDFDCSHLGSNQITMTVTDINGNIDSCISTLVVYDTNSPIVSCIDTLIYLDSTGNYSIDTSYVLNNVTDNCGVDSVWMSKINFDCSELGQNDVVLYAKDISGNIDSCISIVTVLDTSMPIAFAGNDTNICGHLTINMAAKKELPHQVGNWSGYVSGSTLSYGNLLSNKSSVTNLSFGTHQLIWSVSNGNGCNINYDTVQVNVLNTLFALAGPDDTLCNLNRTNLTGISPPYGITGYWQNLSGPTQAVITDSNSITSGVSGLFEGTYEFLWTVSNGFCGNVYDTIQIDVFNPPISNVGPDQDLCGEYSTSLIGSALIGRSIGQWSVISASNSSVPSFSAMDSSLTTISGLMEGTYEIAWTVRSGNCMVVIDTMVINVYDVPFANAGVDTILCSDDSLRMYANLPAGSSTGIWSYNLSKSMTILPTSSDMNSNTSDVTNLIIGESQSMIWTVSNGVCPSVSDTMLISVLERPIVNAGRDTGYCSEYEINLNATPFVGLAQGLWYIDSSTAPNIPIIGNKFTPMTRVSGLIEGTYRFIWRGTNFPCYDFRDTVEISIYNQSLASIGPDQFVCDKSEATISGNLISGTASSRWSLVATNLNIPTFNSTSISTTLSGLLSGGVYEMEYLISNGVCPASADTLVVNNLYAPLASIGFDTNEICTGGIVNFSNNSLVTLPETIASQKWSMDGVEYFVSNPSKQFNVAGFYNVELIIVSANGCADTSKLENLIEVHENPTAEFDIAEFSNSTEIRIRDYSKFATNYFYKFGDGNTSSYSEPSHFYSDSGSYTVWQYVTNSIGCVDSASRSIYMQWLAAFLPNTFTPNNDGINDEFTPIVSGDDLVTYEFTIYNRWGEQIFFTNEKNKGWNGKFNGTDVPQGVYVWALQTKSSGNKSSQLRRGNVNLIR